jgi:hypothetical protein
MYPFYQEFDLLKPVVDYFKSQAYIVKCEVKIGFCRADIVAFKKQEVVAVELKLRDWKKAIIQAKNYQLGADFVFLAFPLWRSYNILRKAEVFLRREGIGLLIINDQTSKVYKIIDAKFSQKKMGNVTLKDFRNISTNIF